MKEHDIALNKLKEWKKRFQAELDSLQKEVLEFKAKDRMLEADHYVAQLDEISHKLGEANEEVSHRCRVGYSLTISNAALCQAL